MSVILGIDPGSRITGYGIIDVQDNELTYLDSGCIRIKGTAMPERLAQIYHCVRELVTQYQPDEAAIEEVFMHMNAGGALKLGQARGGAITAIVQDDIPVGEYSARQIKKAVVGTGAADKAQVQHMVTALLKLSSTPQSDAADALAVAICHINTQKSMNLINSAQSYTRKRLR
jgi:crossover junction endodeoxyribonuclease RuvC